MEFDNARITSTAIFLSRGDLVEQAIGDRLVAKERDGLTAGVERARLPQRDGPLSGAPRQARLRFRGLDATVRQERRGQVGGHRLAVGARAAELGTLSLVTHGVLLGANGV